MGKASSGTALKQGTSSADIWLTQSTAGVFIEARWSSSTGYRNAECFHRHVLQAHTLCIAMYLHIMHLLLLSTITCSSTLSVWTVQKAMSRLISFPVHWGFRSCALLIVCTCAVLAVLRQGAFPHSTKVKPISIGRKGSISTQISMTCINVSAVLSIRVFHFQNVYFITYSVMLLSVHSHSITVEGYHPMIALWRT